MPYFLRRTDNFIGYFQLFLLIQMCKHLTLVRNEANLYLVPYLMLTSSCSFPNSSLRNNGALERGDSSMLSECDLEMPLGLVHIRVE